MFEVARAVVVTVGPRVCHAGAQGRRQVIDQDLTSSSCNVFCLCFQLRVGVCEYLCEADAIMPAIFQETPKLPLWRFMACLAIAKRAAQDR